MTELSIPTGSTVLVTGVNGLIGSHTADQLLDLGYKVRGTVRDASRAQWLSELFDAKYGPHNFELAIVPSMDVEGAWDEVVKGVSGIAHVATNLSFSPDPNTVIPEVVNGALGLLKSAACESSVKSVVYTSSASATGPIPLPNVKRTVTADLWFDEASTAAWAPPPYEDSRKQAVYAASKMEAEKACWKFVKGEKPGFTFNSVVPCIVFGSLLHEKQVSASLTWLRSILQALVKGDIEYVKVNGISPFWYIDVRDTAGLHVAALINPTVKSERIFAYANPFNWNAILEVLRRIYPGRALPDDIPNEAKDLSIIPARERSVELLKALRRDGFISLEESVKSTLGGPVA